MPDRVDNLLEVRHMLGGHADACADHDAFKSLVRESVQNVVAQASVRSDWQMLGFPTPIMHELHVPLDAFGHARLVQA